jgi:hypothetical protein
MTKNPKKLINKKRRNSLFPIFGTSGDDAIKFRAKLDNPRPLDVSLFDPRSNPEIV